MFRVRRLSWISIAQRTASTALGNSASTASPAVLKIRPPPLAMKSSVTCAIGRQTPQRLFFVLGNQPAVAGNIGRKNRRDLAFHEVAPGKICARRMPPEFRRGATKFQRPPESDERWPYPGFSASPGAKHLGLKHLVLNTWA